MKNTFKKIGALVLVLMMMLAMGATAFADADLTGDGIVGDFTQPDKPVTQDKTVLLYKEITVYNPETCTVNAPTVTYSYTIAAGSADKDIYDVKTAHDPNANVHVQTKAGVGSPTISGSVDNGTNYVAGQLVFTPDVQFSAGADGVKNAFKLKVDFSNVNFLTVGSGAGVYRYVINETTEETTKNAAGIKEGSGANTLYMDVYVDGSGNIYGYVLFTNDNSIDARDDATTNTVADAGKVEGFVDTDTSATVSTADEYFTFNLEVSKKVVNDAYAIATKHQFPFTITLANDTVTAAVLPIMTITGDATQENLTAKAIAGTWAPTIADSAVIKYVGIPCGTTVTIYEKNDVVGVTYASKSEKADTDAAVKNIFYDEVSNNAIVNCGATALAKATENHTAAQSKQVLFTNTLLQISPTGIVMRVAPYALILAAGVVLLVLSRKRRNRDEA